jgi:hypothetical protein
MRQSTLFFLIAAASCLAAPSPRIRVRIYDYTRISQPELNRATSEATQRLAEAGIASDWVPCRMHSRPVADPRCDKSITPADFVMNILPHGMAARFKQPANALAFTAITPESPQNCETWVFYDAVRALGEHDASTGAILGGVMAHELGHLLQASDAHAESGVMLASWSPQQLDELERGGFRLTPRPWRGCARGSIGGGTDRRINQTAPQLQTN